MVSFHLAPFIEGLATTAGLIVAIGPQNAFILKQALLRNHVLILCSVCVLIDAILIAIGVSGLGLIFTSSNWLMLLAKYGGAAFLTLYGARSFLAAFRSQSMKIDLKSRHLTLSQALSTVLVMSLLNPHVYLDTCILIGTIGAQFNEHERLSFIAGAILASVGWFVLLGYGAKFLIPFFQKPSSWKILDCIIGTIMWIIAYSLI